MGQVGLFYYDLIKDSSENSKVIIKKNRKLLRWL